MIPFNKPYMTGKELWYIAQAHANGHLSGDGDFTQKCSTWLKNWSGTHRALLTHSCTAALEMAALLINIQPGDEVIMPSYTFVSTANAFVLRGGVPVFIDIRNDTLNLDESLIEAAITPRTRAIVPVHYAGVSCKMDVILAIAAQYRLFVIEDAAQGIMARYQGKALGSLGHLGAYSFHETKNVIAGEGGALLINDPNFIAMAEIIREKGTDRSRFHRGEIDKYTWQQVGSSFLPGEIIAAFLLAQLEEAETLTNRRLALWNRYHMALEPLELAGKLCRPTIPQDCTHNAHMYYLLLPATHSRQSVLQAFKRVGVQAIFHYIPLHLSPAGQRYSRISGSMKQTENISQQIIRIPLWTGMSLVEQDQVIEAVTTICS